MTRIYKEKNETFSVQDKFLFWWINKKATGEFIEESPYLLIGFNTLDEALQNCQTKPVYIHENCFED